MRLQRLVRTCVTSAAFVGTLLILQAASAMGQGLAKDLGPRALADALDIFAADTGLQVVYHSEIATGLKSQGAKAGLSAEETLRQLLHETGLTFEFLNERTIAIRAVSATAGSESSQSPSTSHTDSSSHGAARTSDWLDRLRLAQAESSTTGPSAAASAAEENMRALDRSVVELGEVVVTGTNIRGVYPSSSPVQIYTAEDIARTGATTTEQFIEKLPQNFGTVTAYGSTSSSREGNIGIDLRGLGVGTTLVLINGRRMSRANLGRTANITGIPASAIERVEVLTDGASAIYGSDAIGGVVNFVLREDFEGAETRLSYGGVTRGGLQQGGLTQTFGLQWGAGHGLISYDFMNASALDRADRDYALSVAPGTLSPDDERHNLLATFSQDLTDRFNIGADILLSRRDVESSNSSLNVNPLLSQLNTDRTREDQGLINLGLDFDVSDSTRASLRASYSENDSFRDSVRTRFNNPSVPPQFFINPSHHKALDLTAMVDGSVLALPGGDLRYSVGAGVLDEDYTGTNQGLTLTTSEMGRRTTYAFAEVFAPLVGPDRNVPFVHRLELSVAARYTAPEDTSRPSINRDFDAATDPKIGLLWAPTSALSLRGTYGTSFRAPSLAQLDPLARPILQFFTNTPIPAIGGPLGTQMTLAGVAPDLEAETAETYTVGFDLRPESFPGFELSATYYSIDYTDRITAPPFAPEFNTRPQDFPEVWTRQPSAATIATLLRQSQLGVSNITVDLSNIDATAATLAGLPNLWLIDFRDRNLAVSRQDGLDFRLSHRFDTSWGRARLGADVAYILDYKQQAFASVPVTTTVDVAHFPVDLRGRVYFGISRGGFDGTLGVKYVDDYRNGASAPGIAANAPIESWTTADLSLSYDFGEDGSGLFEGVRLSLSAQNLFDQDPPFLTSFSIGERFGFDKANANPLGRLIVVGVSKRW